MEALRTGEGSRRSQPLARARTSACSWTVLRAHTPQWLGPQTKMSPACPQPVLMLRNWLGLLGFPLGPRDSSPGGPTDKSLQPNGDFEARSTEEPDAIRGFSFEGEAPR